MKSLGIPPAAIADPHAKEVINVWLANGKVYVSLNVGGWKATGQEDEQAWAFLFSDIAKHVANALKQEKGFPPEYTLKVIAERLGREIKEPTHDVSGGWQTPKSKKRANQSSQPTPPKRRG